LSAGDAEADRARVAAKRRDAWQSMTMSRPRGEDREQSTTVYIWARTWLVEREHVNTAQKRLVRHARVVWLPFCVLRCASLCFGFKLEALVLFGEPFWNRVCTPVATCSPCARFRFYYSLIGHVLAMC
jgi:hypothetical protein